MPPGPRPKRRTTIVGCSASGHPFATRRVATMAFAAALVAGACSGGSGATTAPASSAAPRQQCSRDFGRQPHGGWRGHRLDRGEWLVHRPAHLRGRQRGLQGAEPRVRLHGRGSRHRRRLQEVLRGRDRHQRRLAQDQGRGSRDLRRRTASTYIELKVAIDGISVITSTANTAVTCLCVRRPVRLVGPESDRLRQVERRRRARQGARLEHDLPRRAADDHRPRRGVGHLRLLRRARPRPRATPRQSRRPGHDHAPGLHRQRQRQRDHRGHRRQRHARSAGSASPTTRRTSTRSRRSQVAKDANGTASSRRPRRSPAGQYPLSRDLYIYVNKAKATENPAIAAWVDFYLADGTIDGVLETVPYVALKPDALKSVTGRLDGRAAPTPPPLLRERVRPARRPGRAFRQSHEPPWRARTEVAIEHDRSQHDAPTVHSARRCGAARRGVGASASSGRSSWAARCCRSSSACSSSVTVLFEALEFLSRRSTSAASFGIGWFPRRGIFDVATILLGTLIVTVDRDAHRHARRARQRDLPRRSTRAPRLRRMVKPILEILAGIPSVVHRLLRPHLHQPDAHPTDVPGRRRASTSWPLASASASCPSRSSPRSPRTPCARCRRTCARPRTGWVRAA